MTGDCENCNHELGYYEKLWICGCDCNKDWQPVAVVVERKIEDAKPKAKRATRSSVASSSGTTTPVGDGPSDSSETEDGGTAEA